MNDVSKEQENLFRSLLNVNGILSRQLVALGLNKANVLREELVVSDNVSNDKERMNNEALVHADGNEESALNA